MKLVFLSLRSMLVAISLVLPIQAFADDAIYSRSVTGDFNDIRFDVENAIVNRGFVIDYHAKIGDMLDRTSADVGSTRTVYAGADSWQFCSSVLSRKMVEANPANMAYCPYIVFAYATIEAPDKIVVGFRRPSGADESSEDVMGEIDKLLTSIVDEIVE